MDGQVQAPHGSQSQPTNHVGAVNSPEGCIIIRVQGHLLLLPKDQLTKSADYFGSIFSGAENQDSPGELKGIRDLDEVLPLLFTDPTPSDSGKCAKSDPPPIDIGAKEEAKPTRDPTYYLDTVNFQVEDCLFSVLKHSFLSPAIFNSISSIKECSHSLRLSEVRKVDFRAFLKFIDPMTQCNLQTLSQAEWESVFTLATVWKMSEVCDIATKNLSSEVMSPKRRITLGRDYKIEAWVHQGYEQLALREAPLSLDDFRSLGLKTALELSQVARRQQKQPTAKPTPQITWALTFEGEFNRMKPNISVIHEIIRARKYGIAEWLQAAYLRLIKRERDLTVEEAEQLGLDTAVHICALRERVKMDGAVGELELAIGKLLQSGLGEAYEGWDRSLDLPHPARSSGWGWFDDKRPAIKPPKPSAWKRTSSRF